MIFIKTKWVLSSPALQIKEVHLAGLYIKFLRNVNPATVKKKNKISSEFFFFTKNDKDEFNTILKHLIKLVKNFKTHCYVFFFFSNIFTFSNFFFLFTCTSVVRTKGSVCGGGGVTGVGEGGAVLTDRGEEGLRGEVSTLDLNSSVTS